MLSGLIIATRVNKRRLLRAFWLTLAWLRDRANVSTCRWNIGKCCPSCRVCMNIFVIIMCSNVYDAHVHAYIGVCMCVYFRACVYMCTCVYVVCVYM